MIWVVAFFHDGRQAADAVTLLAEDGMGPERTRVDGGAEDGIRVSVAVDESDHDAMVKRMKESGAHRLELDRSGAEVDQTGRPSLTDPEPPPPHRSG